MRLGKLPQFLRQRFSRWLDKRQPSAERATLHQGVIYILPSRFGCWFLLLIALLYLLGTNYQNNLILLVSFILLSIMLGAMLLAFFNVNQLQLTVANDSETFADKAGQLALVLQKNQAQMLYLGLRGQRLRQGLSLLQGESRFNLDLPLLSRGCYPLPRLVICSDYPLGLFRVWSYPALKAQIWVYPTPENAPSQLAEETVLNAQQPDLLDELPAEVKAYQAGDNTNRILWKKLATMPQHPVVRQQNVASAPMPEWVIIPAVQGVALELLLRQACQTLLSLEQQGTCYGLQTPLERLAPATGSTHLKRCLQALALC